MHHRNSVRALFVAAMLCACGGGDGDGGRAGSSGSTAGMGGNPTFDAGSDPMRNDVTPGEICNRVAEIQCAGQQFCCDSPGQSLQDCMEDIEGQCSDGLMLDAIAAAPAVGFNAEAASVAFTELERRASMCDPEVGAWAVSADGFPSSFAGTLASGANCEPSGGLQAPIDQLLISLASCRIGEGLVCLPGDSGWSCAPRAGAGGRCFNDFNCQDGFYCENPDGEFNGVCTAAKAAGADCDGPTQCASLICSDDTCGANGDVQAAYCF